MLDLKNITTKKELEKYKLEYAKVHKLKKIPKNSELINSEDKRSQILSSKQVRTLSGVTPLAIMSKPANCPQQAKCIYCPGGIGSYFGNTPKSYPGDSPAIMRAKRNNYDPYLQAFNRLEHYILLNQDITKIDVIVMGSTFLAFNKKYKDDFIMYIYKACNDFSKLFFTKETLNFTKFKKFFELPAANFKDEQRVKKVQEKCLKIKKTSTLEKEKKRNEKTIARIIGLDIETRPDYGLLLHGNEMLEYGTTKVELGIQSVYEDVLRDTKRGHTVEVSKESIRILKDLGFKVLFHYMPGMIKDKKRDLKGMQELFTNSDFCPDMLKIYPARVFQGTELYEQYQKGDFTPLNTDDAADMIAEFKKSVPTYCRIMRVNRDVPSHLSQGVDKTNLRQYVDNVCKKKGIICRCIRCREIKNKIPQEVTLLVQEYESSGGKEFFISFEDVKQDLLLGFCRLRFPGQFLRPEITSDSAIIRELHVYSKSLAVGKKAQTGSMQHKGYGTLLMEKAEHICKEHNKRKLVVIAGVGVKNYYIDKLSYVKDGPYVSKIIK